MASQQRNVMFGYVLLIALYIAGSANSGIVFLKPIVLGSLIDGFRFSPTEAGFVVGIETLGIALGVALMALVGTHWSRRRAAMAGSSLAVLASFGPTVSHEFTAMLAQRLLAGFGCGVVTGVVLSTLAAFPNKDRTFGFYYTFHGMVAAVLVPSVAAIVATSGPPGAYTTLALLSAISLVCAFLKFPGKLIPEEISKEDLVPLFSPLSLLLLTVALFYWTGTGALWAFQERIGVEHGFDRLQVGQVIGASHIASLLGGLAASLIGAQFGRLLPIACSVAMTVVSLVTMGISSALIGFAIGALAFNFAVLVYTTLLSGAMATYDPTGRVVLITTVTMSLGLAFGPSIGGLLSSRFGFDAVLLLTAGCHLAALVILVPLLLRLRSQRAGKPVVMPVKEPLEAM